MSAQWHKWLHSSRLSCIAYLYVPHSIVVRVSVSEPHTSELNSRISLIYMYVYIYVMYIVCMSYFQCMHTCATYIHYANNTCVPRRNFRVVLLLVRVGINALYVKKDPYTIRVFLCELIPVLYRSFLCTTTYGCFFMYEVPYTIWVFMYYYLWVFFMYEVPYTIWVFMYYYLWVFFMYEVPYTIWVFFMYRASYIYGSILCIAPPILHKMVPIYIECHTYYYGSILCH